MEIPILKDLVVIFGLAIAVILLCHRVKLPSIVGFLITGVLAGPHGFSLLSTEHDVEIFATIGIVLLLFTVGMEFSLKKILEYKRYFLIGGASQVTLTVLFSAIVALLIGRPIGECIFIGFLVCLSSTAIVLRLLDEKSESDTPHGRLIVGIMIFQDIIAIPMMLMTPMLGSGGVEVDGSALQTVLLAVGLLVCVLIAAAKIVPRFLYYIARTRSRELFLLSVLTICFSVAWLTSSIGLSLSLGAFLAGLIVSESEYRHEAIGDILPFQDVFTSFFFISIGMLLDLGFVMSYPIQIALLSVLVIALKTTAGAFASILVGVPLRTALLVGLGLSQIGEFSFVIAKNGINYGLTDDYRYQLFLAVSLLTMGLTPTLINYSPKIIDLIFKLPFPNSLKSGFRPDAYQKMVHRDHAIIIGFGFIGRQIARVAKESEIPYLALEMNPQTVRDEKQKGEPIYYGDATHGTVLQHLNLADAKLVAVMINDFSATCRIVENIRRLNAGIYIVVRTRYYSQTNLLYELGASEVVPDELGSSFEVSGHILNLFQVPAEKIEEITNAARLASYKDLQRLYKTPSNLFDIKMSFPEIGVESIKVNAEFADIGKSLAEMNMRNQYGITVIAIKRGQDVITSIDSETLLLEDDLVTITGKHGNLRAFARLAAQSLRTYSESSIG